MARRGAGRAKTTKLLPKQLVGMNVESNMSEGLKKFERDIREKALRSAAHAGAIVFYNEMRQRVPVDEGTLFGSIYRYHDEKKSTDTRQVYAVGPNKGKAPHWHLIEYGHWRVNKLVKNEAGKWVATRERLESPIWVAAAPYIRPSFDGKVNESIRAMKLRLSERIKEIQREAQ